MSGIGALITIVLIVLKALGFIGFEWLTVFLPVLIAVGFDVAIWLLGLIGVALLALIGRRR